jgi:polysaccharide pyruvyl transferase WcaK-like protein
MPGLIVLQSWQGNIAQLQAAIARIPFALAAIWLGELQSRPFCYQAILNPGSVRPQQDCRSMSHLTARTPAARFPAARTAHKTAWYGGWLGHRNLGDEASYAAIRDAFRPACVVHPRSRLSNAFRKVGLARQHDLVIVGGGTQIGETGFRGPVLRAMERCDNCVVFGTGVEDPAFWPSRDPGRYDLDAWRPILQRSAYIGVRGPRSQRYLQEIGIESEVIGDPACMFVRPRARPAATKCRLGVNLGSGSQGMFGNDELVFESLLGFAKKMLADGWDITPYVVFPGDMPIVAKLARQIGLPQSNIRCFYNDPAGFMDSVSEESVFVGFKLHAVVLAYCAHVPALMIEYRPKCRDFMESIGADDFVIRADLLTVDHLLSSMEKLDARGPALISATSQRLEYFRQKQIATARRVISQTASNVREMAA